MEENKKGLVNKFIKKFFTKPGLIIGITAAVTIVGVGGFYAVNKSGEAIVGKYRYNFSGYSTNRFPDGSFFSPDDILNKNIVNDIKNSYEEYSHIDVDKMFNPEKGAAAKEVLNKDGTKYYTIQAPTRFFNYNREKTIDFLELVNNKFISFVHSKYENVLIKDLLLVDDKEIEQSYDAVTYFDILTNLERQNKEINRFIASTTQLDGDNVIAGNRNYELELEKYFNWYEKNGNLIVLREEIINKKYVKNFELSKEIANSIVVKYNKEIEKKIKIIDELTAMYLQLTDSKENVETNQILEILSNHITEKIWYENELLLYTDFVNVNSEKIDLDFDSKVKTIYTTTHNFVKEINAKYMTFQQQNIKAVNFGEKKYEAVKKFNMAFVGVALLLGSFVVTGLTLVGIDELKQLKKPTPQKTED